MVLFPFHPLTLCFSATIKALWVCSSVFFLLEKGLWLSGSLWELLLIAACVVNYEVHFQRAMQIVLEPEACRGETTWQRATSKGEQAAENILSLKITEHLPLEKRNAAVWKLKGHRVKKLMQTFEFEYATNFIWYDKEAVYHSFGKQRMIWILIMSNNVSNNM